MPSREVCDPADYDAFQSVVSMMKGELASTSFHVAWDSEMRKIYSRSIEEMARSYEDLAMSGKLSWSQAAREASELRNETMDLLRHRSTPLGRAFAQSIKRQGRTLNEMIALKTVQKFGQSAKWSSLSVAQKQSVFLMIVQSAGKSNDKVNRSIRNLSRAGRGLVVLSVAWSIYTVATADDHIDALAKEATTTGAGIAGGIAGGALAGLACGPGAPACVAVGAFVGGALAAFSVDMVW